MDLNVKPQTLVETFEYNIALIILLTYHAAERSFSSMRRLQTPLRRTMTDKHSY